MFEPLIGRHVRFEGQHRGTEGILLAIEDRDAYLTITLERTGSAGMHPPEPDGAHRVVFLTFDPRVDVIFVKPQTSADAEKLRKLVRAYFDANRAFSRARRSADILDPAREVTRGLRDAAFYALQAAIGHDLGPIPSKESTEVKP